MKFCFVLEFIGLGFLLFLELKEKGDYFGFEVGVGLGFMK